MNPNSEQLYPNPEYQKQLHTELTREELRALKECGSESFYYRSLPFGCLFTTLTYMGVKRGVLSGHPTYGSVPKMVGAAFFGFVLGKISYTKTCREKLLKLENSQLAERLKAGKYGHQNSKDLYISKPAIVLEEDTLDKTSSPLIEEFYPDLSQHVDGLDSYDSVTDTLSPYVVDEKLDHNQSNTTSYDDLRKANRASHNIKSLNKSSSHKAPDDFDSYSLPREVPPTSSPEPYFNTNKNKYGDVLD